MVANLKRTAASAYQRFYSYMEGYDCGAAMLKEIKPAAAHAAKEYNDAMTELRRIDPECPEFTPL